MVVIPRGTSGRTAAEIARSAALEAGKVMLDRFNRAKEISYKGPGNIVTDVDIEVERLIRSTMKAEFPDMAFLGEESAGELRGDKGYVWVVDPLDGTRNYAAGIPFYSTVIGLAKDGDVLVGVNYAPVRTDMFEAEKGRGAFLNGLPVKVSDRTGLKDCVIGVDLSYNSMGAARAFELLRGLWPNMQTARIMGSSALGLSYAATGRTDLYFHHSLAPWDMVAGILMVQEAGGVITDRNGKRMTLYSDGVIASSRRLHTEFLHRTEGLSWREPTQRLA